MNRRVRRRGRLALLATAIVLGGCASSGSASSGSGGGASNGSREPSGPRVAESGIRDMAALLMQFDTRSKDTLLVARLLESARSASRARAALVVGQNDIASQFTTVRQLLVDADTGVAANAAYALGLGKDAASLVALGRAFAGAPDAVAREAAWAFGEIGEPARTLMTIALGEGTARARSTSTAAQRSPIVRAELLYAMNKLTPMPVPIVATWAEDTSSVVARAAVYSLTRQRLPGAVRYLLPLAGHPDEGVRQGVARGLSRELAGDSLGAKARLTLSTLLADASPRVRANAARSVGTYGVTARRDLETALSDADGNVRAAATENVGTVFASDSALWMKAWTRDTSYAIRRALLMAARRAGSAALVGGERAWFSDGDWRFRDAAIGARALATDSARLSMAREALTDNDARVRASALALLPPADAATASAARSMLSDPDVVVRATAIRVLTRGTSADDLAMMIEGYQRALRDKDNEARDAALRYIAAAWTRDSTGFSASARAALAALPVPKVPAARLLVATVTPLASWRDAPPPAPRALVDYERIVRRYMLPGSRQPTAVLRTERGDITLALDAVNAPLVVDAFVTLARSGYYRNSRFHRVVPNFVAQDGDPRGTGNGGPGFALRDAYSRHRHERGCLGLATSGPDTGGSQYYLCHWAQPHLDGHYTVFGSVLAGLPVMDAIVQGDRVLNVEIR